MAFILTFIILIIFWIFLSGLFDAWHFTLGIISCALIAYISSDLLFRNRRVRPGSFSETIRLLGYLPWLLYQIVLANLQIAYLALHPKMQSLIDPHIIKFRTKLKKDLSLVLFGNSITLTPGTITILIEDDYYYVHAINRSIAKDLPGMMEEKVGRIFMED